MEDQFTCAMCRITFNKGRSDEVAMQEATERWERNRDIDLGDLVVICDDCMNKLREQHPELR